MPTHRAGRKQTTTEDVLEVVHHEIPDNAAAAGAAPISPPASGITWRRMLRGLAIAEAAGMAAVLVAGLAYGLDFFAPLAIAAILFAVAAAWMGRMSKASVVYTLVITSLALAMFGGMFWPGFLHPQSWLEMTTATLTVLLPIAGIAAAIATLRHREGADSARIPALVVGALAALLVLTGIAASALVDDAVRLPGDATLTATNFDFEQTSLTAKAGDVAIWFDNQDPFGHNVRIEGYGTSDDAAGRQAIRHVFRNVPAGTYTFFCVIHPDMEGTITVT